MQRRFGQRFDLSGIGYAYGSSNFFVAVIRNQCALRCNAQGLLFSRLIIVIKSKDHEFCESRIVGHRVDGRRLFATGRTPARIRIHQHWFARCLCRFQCGGAERLNRRSQGDGCESQANCDKREHSKCVHRASLA